ncbi:odorant receptor 131-2-like [Pholidichthys leucotaenia]
MMMNESQSHSNITAELEDQKLLRLLIISILSMAPTCVFLFINGTMLFTLRSKPVFRETCRYILLYNLLFADTIQLAQGQLQYLLSICKVKLPYSVCGFLSFLANLTTAISPLTLVLMPLERYVAVCYPLRHAAILTIRNTGSAISLIWGISSLNNLTRLLFFLDFPLENLQVKNVCSRIALLLAAKTDLYDKVYTCVLFISAGVAVLFSYISVIIAARSASTDKTLACRARNTLLLNLTQLGLSLSSTFNTPLLIALSGIMTRMAFLWIQNAFYVIFIIFPRCFSSLIYGLRDQTIRPVLMYHLCCQGKISPGTDSGGTS